MASDDDAAALNRIAYLGGILLPFSVIGVVFSMDDPFRTGGKLFWVFWVVSVPLTLLTLFLIYADNLSQIRVERELPGSHDHATTTAPVRPRTQATPQTPTAQASFSTPDDAFAHPRAAPAVPRPDAAAAGQGLDEEILLEIINKRRRRQFRIQHPTPTSASSSTASPPPPPPPSPHTAGAGTSRFQFGDGDETVVVHINRSSHPRHRARGMNASASTYMVGPPGRPAYTLEVSAEGSHPRVWRWQKLGWYGACQSMLGLETVHKAEDVAWSLEAV